MALFGVRNFGDGGVEVTGIAASGTTDGAGTWNTTTNIETILSAAGFSLSPAATAVAIRMTNMSTSAARWGGVRQHGKTNAIVLRDCIAGNEDNMIIVPVNTSDDLVDFYTESIGGSDRTRFLISHEFVGITFFDIDGTLPTQSSTASATSTRTISEVPANATILAKFATSGRWIPTTETTLPTNTTSGLQLMKVDGSKQLKLNSSSVLTIYGYWDDGIVTWEPWLTRVITPTADSTFRNSGITLAGKAAVFGFHDEATTGTRVDARAEGSSRASAPASGISGSYNSILSPLDSNGDSEYFLETGASGNIYYLATFDEYTGAASSVITPATITPGETFTIIPSNFDGAITSLTATDAQGNTLTLSVTSNQATMPALAAGVLNLLMGDITIEVTDGTDAASDTSSYIADTGYSYINVGTPLIDGHSIGSGLADDSIIVAALDQIYYPTAYATSVASNTTIESNLLDDYVTVYLTVGTDHNGLTSGMVYQVDYYFDGYGGGSVVDNSLTSTGLTSVGLTLSGLTASGL